MYWLLQFCCLEFPLSNLPKLKILVLSGYSVRLYLLISNLFAENSIF